MAGSYFNRPNQDDTILRARVEALSSLADHITEPVVILDPELRLIYSNEPAKNIGQSCPLFEEASGDRMEPLDLQNKSCDFCPTHRVFQEEEPNPHPGILSRNGTVLRNGTITSPPERQPSRAVSRDEAFHALLGETPVMQQLNERSF